MPYSTSSYALRALLVAGVMLATAATAQTPPTNPQLFLLMGQSNMAGRAPITPQDLITHPRIWMLTQENQWVLAKDPLHYDLANSGVGLASQFARDLAAADPQINIGLIPVAMSGSSLNQWAPGSTNYNNAVTRTRIALANGQLAGFLWHQGEADTPTALAATYLQRFATFIGRIRADLNAMNVPVVAGELGLFRASNSILNPTLALIPQRVPLAGFATAEGLKDKGDILHFDTPSMYEFGHRYILQWATLKTWQNFEAENLLRQLSGGTQVVINEVQASDGEFVQFQPSNFGDYLQLTLPNVPAGTYAVKVRFQRNVDRARCRVAMDGQSLGTEIDQSGTANQSAEIMLGNVTFGSGGDHLVRVTVTSSATTSKLVSIDSIVLVPHSSVTPPSLQVFEGETLPNTKTGGTSSILSDAGASAGRWLKFFPSAVGQSITLTTPVIPAGTYTIKFRQRIDPDRGRCTVQVDGMTLGPEIDQYASTTSYTEPVLGAVSWTADGTHTFRVTSSGVHATRNLGIDAFVLVAESAPPPAAPQTWEAESVSKTLSGGSTVLYTDAMASGGNWVKYRPTSFGQFITFQLPVVAAGTYELKYRYKQDPDRGRCTVMVDSTPRGAEIDQYSAVARYVELSLGTFPFATASTHTVRITSSSSRGTSKSLSMDAFILEPR